MRVWLIPLGVSCACERPGGGLRRGCWAAREPRDRRWWAVLILEQSREPLCVCVCVCVKKSLYLASHSCSHSTTRLLRRSRCSTRQKYGTPTATGDLSLSLSLSLFLSLSLSLSLSLCLSVCLSDRRSRRDSWELLPPMRHARAGARGFVLPGGRFAVRAPLNEESLCLCHSAYSRLIKRLLL